MDVFAAFSTRVTNAVHELYPELGEDVLARLLVEPPRDAGHGDLSSNAAMVVAKPLGKSPREIASAIAAHFAGAEQVISVEVAGPGFINFRLADAVWLGVLKSILDEAGDYGRSEVGKSERVNVE